MGSSLPNYSSVRGHVTVQTSNQTRFVHARQDADQNVEPLVE